MLPAIRRRLQLRVRGRPGRHAATASALGRGAGPGGSARPGWPRAPPGWSNTWSRPRAHTEELVAHGGSRFDDCALQVEFADGVRALDLRYDGADINGDRLTVRLADRHRPLTVILRYEVRGPALCRWLELTNHDEAPVLLHRAASATWPVPWQPAYRATTLAGGYAAETRVRHQPLGPGRLVLESRRGIPGHAYQPWIAVDGGAGEETAKVRASPSRTTAPGNWSPNSPATTTCTSPPASTTSTCATRCDPAPPSPCRRPSASTRRTATPTSPPAGTLTSGGTCCPGRHSRARCSTTPGRPRSSTYATRQLALAKARRGTGRGAVRRRRRLVHRPRRRHRRPRRLDRRPGRSCRAACPRSSPKCTRWVCGSGCGWSRSRSTRTATSTGTPRLDLPLDGRAGHAQTSYCSTSAGRRTGVGVPHARPSAPRWPRRLPQMGHEPLPDRPG